MPTSNGQVGRYDIRREAIDATKIMDDAVVADKVKDLAITFPDKIDDPIWTFAKQGEFWNGASPNGGTLDTTHTEFGQILIDIPAWIDQIAVHITADIQFTNDTGSSVAFLSIQAALNGQVYDTNQVTVPNTATASVYHTQVVDIAGVAGSSITVGAVCWISSGSSTNHNGNVRALIVGTRG